MRPRLLQRAMFETTRALNPTAHFDRTARAVVALPPQRDLNLIYEGVDFKPFMRYQILLKFIFVANILSQVGSARLRPPPSSDVGTHRVPACAARF